ncbi:MAG: ATP-binding cassette domain-containing protein [Bacteroidaceae bacterium]|nr:ATP-binding cassette domain-containing protein [Bacteroidaceae bacterium]
MQHIIQITDGVTRHPLYRFKSPINLDILAGEQVAIVGDNGAGKSMLVDVITGKHALLMTEVKYDFAPSKAKMVSDNIKYMTFRDSYGASDGQYYYQQRWNQNDVDEAPTVGELLDEAFRVAEQGITRTSNYDKFLVRDESEAEAAERVAREEADKQQVRIELERMRDRLYDIFHLDQLVDKRVIMLSSGELRKFQLTKTLLTNPRVLIMDNPFIGLDVNARKQLHEFLTILSKETDILIILVLSKTDDIPLFVTHVIPVDDMDMKPKMTIAEYKASQPVPPSRVITDEKAEAILSLPYAKGSDDDAEPGTQHVIDFKDVNIRYGERTILKDLSFSVLNGEHWALSGENGAGKSTLLSIVCADNPQAYANNIVLFDYKRGTGESIWDIKKHIGYISPEMHRAFMRDLPSIDIVASGLSDATGLYKKPKPEQMGICEFWMDVFGIAKYKDTTFLKLSSGEQRLVLLARAFVKDPSLLILDEPLHGLDMKNRRLVKDVIETFCQRKNKTLIMVTHYQEELPKCIDHSIFLKKTAPSQPPRGEE